ncbi:MAG: hypothetical protein GY696_38715 [Gammaproteobacteria bacterium]|nr:hypothetical protein [Gammaproteobacteria bacterium]
MVHTFAPAELTSRQITAEGIMTSGPANMASHVQLVNLTHTTSRSPRGRLSAPPW